MSEDAPAYGNGPLSRDMSLKEAALWQLATYLVSPETQRTPELRTLMRSFGVSPDESPSMAFLAINRTIEGRS